MQIRPVGKYPVEDLILSDYLMMNQNKATSWQVHLLAIKCVDGIQL